MSSFTKLVLIGVTALAAAAANAHTSPQTPARHAEVLAAQRHVPALSTVAYHRHHRHHHRHVRHVRHVAHPAHP